MKISDLETIKEAPSFKTAQEALQQAKEGVLSKSQ